MGLGKVRDPVGVSQRVQPGVGGILGGSELGEGACVLNIETYCTDSPGFMEETPTVK